MLEGSVGSRMICEEGKSHYLPFQGNDARGGSPLGGGHGQGHVDDLRRVGEAAGPSLHQCFGMLHELLSENPGVDPFVFFPPAEPISDPDYPPFSGNEVAVLVVPGDVTDIGDHGRRRRKSKGSGRGCRAAIAEKTENFTCPFQRPSPDPPLPPH